MNKMQKIGLKYHEEIKQRIPRDEVAEISETVKTTLKQLYPHKPLIIETCGSYRRGRPSCGDVDILITTEDPHDEYNQVQGMLRLLVEKLEAENFLKERLG